MVLKTKNQNRTLTWDEIISLLCKNESFRLYFCRILADVPFLGFFLEMPRLCTSTRFTSFEMCAVEASADMVEKWNQPGSAAREQFPAVVDGRGSSAAVLFPSPSGTILLAPGDVGGDESEPHVSACVHIAKFVREANNAQKHSLFSLLGEQLHLRRMDENPTWLSTDGSGVFWLHLRLANRPVYYKFAPYTNDGQDAKANAPLSSGGGGGGGGLGVLGVGRSDWALGGRYNPNPNPVHATHLNAPQGHSNSFASTAYRGSPSVPSSAYRGSPSVPSSTPPAVCRNFASGHCLFAERCKFLHNGIVPASVASSFTPAAASSSSSLSFSSSSSSSDQVCYFFIQGTCSYGETCKKRHR